MARPPSPSQAARLARGLLDRRLPGPRRTTVRAQVSRAERIAKCIYRRWQVGPYQWQVKHLRWYLEHATKTFAPLTRYGYWLTVRVLVIALAKDQDWLPRLRGPWQSASHSEAKNSRSGRPLKIPT